MPKIYKCIIADDHAVVRLGVSFLLNNHTNYQLLEALENTYDLIPLVKEKKPDIVILDIDIPGPPVRENIVELRKILPDLKIVIYSIYDNHSSQQELISLGADAFVCKRDSEEKLLETLNKIIKF